MSSSREIEMERWSLLDRYDFRAQIPAASLLLFLLCAFLFLAVWQIPIFLRPRDAQYGDMYILYDVHHFQMTGQIYRDLSFPPYQPAIYSPLVYILYSIPPWNAFDNPFVGPRLLALGTFLLCIAMIVSIVRKMIPVRHAWIWGMLMPCSILTLGDWVLALRGDFPAILFSLAAIRLLLAKPRYAVVLAGLSAGFATQFKFVYVASLLAGSLWLLFQKRIREFGTFVTAGILTSAGLYFLFWLCEPRMLSQILALSPGIPEYKGLIRLVIVALDQPLIPLVLPALPIVLSRRDPRWILLLLYPTLAFTIATATGLQAGASMNYFLEALLALVPLATLGTLQLLAWCSTNTGLAIFVAGVALTQFLFRATGGAVSRTLWSPTAVRADNNTFRKLSAVLYGEKILSTVESMTALDPQPALVEPNLASYEKQLGKFDMRPLLQRVGASQFDVVITSSFDQSSRGIHHVDPLLREAIEANYKPNCVILGTVIYFPRSREPSKALIDSLLDIGCTPVGHLNGYMALSAEGPE